MNREIKIGTILSWVPQKDGSFEHRNGTIVIVQELAVKKFGTLKVISSKTSVPKLIGRLFWIPTII